TRRSPPPGRRRGGRRSPRRRAASRRRRRAPPRPRRVTSRRAHPARRARSARRRRERRRGSSAGRDLALDPARVLLVLEGRRRELDDPFLPVKRVLPPDRNVLARVLDHVVTGPGVATQTQRRDRSGVDDEEVLEPPRVRDVLVPREDEMDARP